MTLSQLSSNRVVPFAALLLSLSIQFALALEEGLVGYWPFDEGSGEAVADLSGQGHNGMFAYGQPEWVDGKSGSALYFDGESGVEIPDFYGISGSTPRTVAFWVKTDDKVSAGGATVLVGFGFHASGQRWHVKFEASTQSIRTENQGS